jgi:exonuclease SbcD
MDFHFLHAADIHLDSPLRGLSSYEGAPVEPFRNATREALRNLVTHAVETGAAFIVIAGDLYDGDWPDFSTGLFLVKELERLNRAGIRAVVLFGNHDAESRITKSLPWPGNTYRFSARKPETIVFEDLGVALHGQSFVRVDVTDNLAEHYPAPVPGKLNIGVLHTALEGNASHARYAPCSLNQLRNHGYAYWALGHVHAHLILNEDPWIVYPGNLQGRHIRETGAKGCMSVSVQDGQIISAERVILDVVRWIDAEAPADGCDDLATIVERCSEAIRTAIAGQADAKPAAVRVRITGRTAAHGELVAGFDQLQAELQARMLGMPDCWLEAAKIHTEPPPGLDTAGAEEAVNLLAGLLADAESDPDLRQSLEAALRPLLEKVPATLGSDAAVGEPEDFPLLFAARTGDMPTLVRRVLPDLLNMNTEG